MLFLCPCRRSRGLYCMLVLPLPITGSNCSVLSHRGFSLVEALMALSITAMAGAVLLLSVESSLQTTTEAVERTIADGIAQQTLDEILTKRYVEAGENGDGAGSAPLGPTAWEATGAGSERFNDIDDYNGLTNSPIKGIYGEALGAGDDQGNLRLDNFRLRSDFFQNWRKRVLVYYVDPNNPSAGTNSGTTFRAIEVIVELIDAKGATRPLAKRTRIIAYITPSTS